MLLHLLPLKSLFYNTKTKAFVMLFSFKRKRERKGKGSICVGKRVKEKSVTLLAKLST